jgi:putative endonuclease
MDRRERGHAAEQAAVALLRSKGYTILATNYRCRLGELDIVARDGDELVFVEVRSRATGRHGDALDAIGPSKQRQVARVAQAYLSRENPDFASSRFDVVAQTGDELEHIVDAFRAD